MGSEPKYSQDVLERLNFRTIPIGPSMLFARRDDVDWVLMIKSGKLAEYPYPLLHAFVKGDYELGRIFRWLDEDWDFKIRRPELTVKLAEETLTKFGWHWDSPENVRQSALREAIAVHGLWHLRRCLLFLERTWSESKSIKRQIASDAVHLERLWFVRDCVKASSDFQRQMREFWRSEAEFGAEPDADQEKNRQA